MSEKYAVHYGAGNIGRGFIGPLLVQSGYHVIFADVIEAIINALNEQKKFDVQILGQSKRVETVSNVSGVMSNKPELIDAIAKADIITTSVGPNILRIIAPSIANGLSKRHQEGKGYINIIACENLVGATDKLKDEVLKHLAHSPDVLAYVEKHVGFANCAVDRIVPPFKGSNILEVGVEEFFEWVVDETSLKGPKLNINGMKLTDNLPAYVERKLYTLNCAHASLAFLGLLRGYATIHDAVGDSELKTIDLAIMREGGAALVKKHGFNADDHEKYIQKIISRFENPNVVDELVRVGRQPIRKLSKGDRLIGPISIAKQYGLPRDNLLKAVAAGYLHDTPEDDESVKLRRLISDKGLEATVIEISGFEKGSPELETVLKEYDALQKSSKKA